VAALAVLWFVGLVVFAETLPGRVNDPERVTDAVVVLTGGTGRLAVGIELLAAKKARKLFISGVYRGVDVAQILRLFKRQGEELECCMVLGHAADDTRGNATETARWMATEGFTSLRLVTANYHMRRSLIEFRRAMPGIALVPHPVFPTGFKAESWWRWPGSASLIAGEFTKYLIALARPW
jgi:uncharacterized SAM-binding protein YcdF (DUF218 family)